MLGSLTLKPACKYKQISTENAYADKSAFTQCLKQSTITLERLVTEFVPVNLPLKAK